MQVSLSVNNILLFLWTHLLIKVKSPELSVWEQKISEKKDENFKGLCHILLLLPHPVRGQQGTVVSRSNWSTGCNKSADWLKDCRSWAPILNINTRNSSLFSQKPGAVRVGVRCATALWQKQLCGFSTLARLNQRFTPHGTTESLPASVSNRVFRNVFLNCC